MAEPRTNQRWREEPSNRALRAADEDREAVATLLREEHLAGRIDSTELEERLGRCLSARTYADLDQLVADLPRPQPSRPRRRRGARPGLAFPVIPFVIIAVLLSLGHALWLIVPAFFILFVRPMLFGRRWGCIG